MYSSRGHLSATKCDGSCSTSGSLRSCAIAWSRACVREASKGPKSSDLRASATLQDNSC
jgi:hypothetical protein